MIFYFFFHFRVDLKIYWRMTQINFEKMYNVFDND